MTQPICILPFTVVPQDGRYRVICSGCGKVDVKSLHGVIKCNMCNTEANAHDMLMEYKQRQEFLDNITGRISPASAQANATPVKTPGARG